jgi:hypothetical protein
MSKSNASAKNRRAFIDNSRQQPQFNPTIPSTPSQSPAQPSQGLTLQQVISVIDKRLINVETFVKESKEDSNKKISFEDDNNEEKENLNDVILEYNSRFTILAEEISNIKDILLKLQSYTMSVNKTLMEERIHVLSDLGTNIRDLDVENINNEVNPDTILDALNEPEPHSRLEMVIDENGLSDNVTDSTQIIGNYTLENNEVKTENFGIKLNTISGTNVRRNRNK